MDTALWTRVEDYLARLLLPEDPGLDAALESAQAAGLPSIQVSAPQGRLLQVLARVTQARSILEIGTLGGYSTAWLARGLAPGGGVVTLEAEPAHAAVARANLERLGLLERVTILEGRAQDSLPRLAESGRPPFDLVFIDADKAGYPEYFRWSLRLTRRGALIVADNVVRDGKVADPGTSSPEVVGVRTFLELVAAEPRVEATAIQTVGAKGYDGLALAVVLEPG